MNHKRIHPLSILFALSMVMLLAGCTVNTPGTKNHDTPMSEMSYIAPYGEGSFSLEHIYARETNQDYKYRLYVICEYDLSKLSEKDRTLFLEDEGEITRVYTMCYLKGGENNLDFDGMFSYPQKGTKLTSDNKYYKLMTYPSFGTSTADDRETFLGTELTVSVDVSEDLVDDSNELKKSCDIAAYGTIDKFTSEEEFNKVLNIMGWESL